MSFVRDQLDGCLTAAEALEVQRHRSRIRVAGGVVTHRQRPGTAKGVYFLNLGRNRPSQHHRVARCLGPTPRGPSQPGPGDRGPPRIPRRGDQHRGPGLPGDRRADGAVEGFPVIVSVS